MSMINVSNVNVLSMIILFKWVGIALERQEKWHTKSQLILTLSPPESEAFEDKMRFPNH